MDTFEIKGEGAKKENINILDTDIGIKIKATALKLEVKQEFSVGLGNFEGFPFPYTALDHILNEVRKETGNGYSIHRDLNGPKQHIGYIIKRFR